MLPAATADLAYWFFGALGAWNIYGALCAGAKDLKNWSHSSVSHMGYVMLGMASFTGGSTARSYDVQHGTITGMLFLWSA
jgi:NADH:ubiquinone oxidoreductase subunit 4 (subunit M)